MIRKGLLIAVLSVMSCAFPSPGWSQEYKLGIQAFKGADTAMKEWKATSDYLTAKLGKTFTVVPCTDNELMEGVKQGKIDFFYANPAIFAEMNKQYGAQVLVTMVKATRTQPTEYLAGTIFTRKESAVKTLADFRGKDFMTRAKSSFAGWMVAKRHFLDKGIDPEKEFKAIKEAKSVEHVVYAVLNGAVEGGAIMAGTLEEMAAAGKVKMADFRVIDQAADNFPFVHTTQLYPEFCIAAGANVPPALKADVAQVLQAVAPTDPAAVNAKLNGWKKPLDYTPVVECLTIVKYGAFARN